MGTNRQVVGSEGEGRDEADAWIPVSGMGSDGGIVPEIGTQGRRKILNPGSLGGCSRGTLSRCGEDHWS